MQHFLSPLKYVGSALLFSYASLAIAQPAQWLPPARYEWFVDHLHVAPSTQASIPYTIPTPQHFMQCMQDSSGSELAAIEWKYKGESFKGQIIGMYQIVSLTRSDYPTPWISSGKTQLADTSGTMIVTNFDKTQPLVLSCVYSLDLN